MAELNKAAKESKVKSFLDKELSIVSKPLNPFDRKEGECNRAGHRHGPRVDGAVS